MRTAAQRIAAYEDRMVSSQIDPVIAAKNAQQKAYFADYANDWVAKQVLVHQYLDGEGCLPVEYFNYDGFANEVYHIANHFSGAAAVAGASDMVIKWTLYGCTAVRLKAVAAIFGIIVP